MGGRGAGGGGKAGGGGGGGGGGGTTKMTASQLRGEISRAEGARGTAQSNIRSFNKQYGHGPYPAAAQKLTKMRLQGKLNKAVSVIGKLKRRLVKAKVAGGKF